MKAIDLYSATSITDEDVKEVMDYHSWDDDKKEKGQNVRDAIGNALKVVIENVPPSHDRNNAIRKLREARMDANSAITHNASF